MATPSALSSAYVAAAAAKAVAAAEEQLLLSALTSGAPQSFCELFYLSRRPRLTRDDPGETPAFMAAVRDALLAGEQGRHGGDLKAALASFSRVGSMYAGGGQHRLAVFFHEQCLGVAQRAGDVASAMAALHLLGFSREALGDLDEAVAHHCARRDMAAALLARGGAGGAEAQTSSTSAEAAAETALRTSSAALVRVFGLQAHLAEAQSATGESLRLSLLALEAAARSGEPAAEARAYYNAGRASVIDGKAAEALPQLEEYLRLSQASSQLKGNVAQALAALAAAHQAVGDKQASAECLQRLLGVAVESGDAAAEAEASEQIGIAFAQDGRLSEAEPHLAKAFELRRVMAQGGGARAALDKVRILLGMVRGDARLAPLFDSIARVDVRALLSWRLQRGELTIAAGGGGNDAQEEQCA